MLGIGIYVKRKWAENIGNVGNVGNVGNGENQHLLNDVS